ncbi:MAG: magnesium/cobalt transporter CorA [Actinomycetota bacterium]|nr:magnesium/cobalt transporter CorA [Actinomycetota bacterium]
MVDMRERPESDDPSTGVNLRVPCLTHLDEEAIRELFERDHFFWLDLRDPSDEELDRVGELFGFHHLAVEDSRNFGQRPKLDEYGDHAVLVFYGAATDDPAAERLLAEVHLYVSGGYVVTVRRHAGDELEELREKLEGRVLKSEQFVVYRILDTLTDTFFPLLARIDDQVDELEDQIIDDPTNEQLQRIFGLKRALVSLRKSVTPQRDIFARGIDQLSELPGLELDERDYFRDVYDHLIRISELIDSYRDLLAGATDMYLSTISNRQNEVMKQLAIIATIFLPLSFLTGFFGQNFAYLVNHVQNSFWAFIGLGLGGLVVACVALALFFRRKRWI